MKVRESGMPDESRWESFFDADCVAGEFLVGGGSDPVIVEFGCGYGTFTLPAARRTRGSVHALDIEPDLVSQVKARSAAQGLDNVAARLCDFVEQGTGLADGGTDHAMLFNILHIDDPVALLREAYRVLRPGGIVSIMHWNHDPTTPRGPPLAIRPRPGQCRAWAEAAGFQFLREADLARCCNYHYGLVLARPRAA